MNKLILIGTLVCLTACDSPSPSSPTDSGTGSDGGTPNNTTDAGSVGLDGGAGSDGGQNGDPDSGTPSASAPLQCDEPEVTSLALEPRVYEPVLREDAAGGVHLAAARYGDDELIVYYRYRAPGSATFGAAETVGTFLGDPSYMAIAFDAEGAPEVLYIDSDGMLNRSVRGTAGWTAAEVTPPDATSFSPWSVTLAGSTLLLLDSSWTVIWALDGDTWTMIDASEDVVQTVDASADASGVVHIVYDRINLDTFDMETFYRTWNPATAAVSAAEPVATGMVYEVAVSTSGEVVAVTSPEGAEWSLHTRSGSGWNATHAGAGKVNGLEFSPAGDLFLGIVTDDEEQEGQLHRRINGAWDHVSLGVVDGLPQMEFVLGASSAHFAYGLEEPRYVEATCP